MAVVRTCLLLLLLCGAAGAQEEREEWSDERWSAVLAAWQAAEDPLLRAAIGRLAWERAATDPLERRACAALADAPHAPPPVRDLLRRVADPPPLEAEAAPVASGVAGLEALLAEAPADPFDQVRRVLRAVGHVDAAGSDEALARRLDASNDPLLVSLRGMPASRRALATLRALEELGPERQRIGDALDEALDLLAARAVARGPRLGTLATFERDARACALAARAERSGRPWLAHALLELMRPPGSLAERVVGMAAMDRVREVTAGWRAGAGLDETLARLAPALAHLEEQTAARALEAGLRRSASLPGAEPPAFAAWEELGQEERLAALDAALCRGTPLGAPFPPDVPLDERGERPTLLERLEAAGWAAVPLLLARADEPALLRAEGAGPMGLARVGDHALAALSSCWGVPYRPEGLLDQRREELDAWWATWGARGPVRCLQETLAGRRADWTDLQPLRLVRLLGGQAAPIVSATLARLPEGRLERAAWLDAAAALGDEAFRPALEAAARAGRPELALVGARGLAALGDEAEAGWLARVALDDPALDAGQGLALLRRLDPATAGRLEREAQVRPPLVAFLRRDRAEVDARLALLRWAALRQGRFATAEDDAAWLAEEGPTALLELTGRPSEWSDRRETVAVATDGLLRELPLADPARRAHAVVTAALLGPEALERLPGLDPRAVVAQALADPVSARRLRAGLGPHAGEVERWLRTWLVDPGAAARLEGPNPEHLLVGEVAVSDGLPAELAAQARALVRTEVTGAELAGLLRLAPALQLRLTRPAWGAWRLALSAPAGARPGLFAVVHRAGVSPEERALPAPLDGRVGPLLLELVAECRDAGPAGAELHLVVSR
jgi:hypothetical protein